MTPKARKRPATQTSAFGAPGRSSHDASRFYGSRLYAGVPAAPSGSDAETPLPADCANRLFCQSSAQMSALPDGCVHLMITSPPYNVSKEYDQDLTLEEYLALLADVWRETYRVLAPGGRACINVANLGRKPYIPLHSYIIDQMLASGFWMRGEIIWDKGATSSPSTAWGSWRSASNPVLRDVHEYILIFSKDSFGRRREGRVSTIGREQFLEWTKSVWTFPTISARKIGHPAPFPEELPHRLIQLFSFQDDVVLDPFAGSGTTCLAAQRDGRRFIGYDINPTYLALAAARLAAIPPTEEP
jgi:site-specific DNA-methyltransferase (adenine-specific)